MSQSKVLDYSRFCSLLSDIILQVSENISQLLSIALAGTAESASEHPLGRAITNHAQQVIISNVIHFSRIGEKGWHYDFYNLTVPKK